MKTRTGRLGSLTVTSTLSALLLCSCGGGSDTASSSITAQTVGAREAWDTILQGNRTFVVVGYGFNYETLKEDDTFEATYSFSAKEAAPSPADGSRQWRIRLSATSKAASTGSTVFPGEEIDFHFDASNRIIGHRSINGCDVVATSTTPPQFANISSSGPLSTVLSQPVCFGASESPRARYAESWNIKTEASIQFFCWRLESYVTDNISRNSAEYCFEVSPQGQVGQRARVSYPGSPGGIVFRNYPYPR